VFICGLNVAKSNWMQEVQSGGSVLLSALVEYSKTAVQFGV
jgi:hypothetical protein